MIHPVFHPRLQLSRLIAGAMLLTLAACISAQPAKRNLVYQPESTYGNFLAARYASASHDMRAAADYYAAAQRSDPANALLVKQAFLSALFAGNIPAAADFARPVLETGAETRLMRLASAAHWLGKKRFSKAGDVLAKGQYGPFNDEARQLLRGWIAFGQNDVDEALSLIAPVADTPLFSSAAALHRALMLDLANRDTEAAAAYADAAGDQPSSDRAAYAYSAYLWRHGEAAKAQAVCKKARKSFVDAPLCRRALTWPDAQTRSAPRLVRNAREGAAEALLEPAQILAAGGHFDRALVYLEMARYIDPNQQAVRELLARLMEVEDRPDDALAMFATIDPASPYRPEADSNRARALFRLERRDEALELYRQLAQSYPDNQTFVADYADHLREMRQYSEALPLYQKLIDDAGSKADWPLYFSRGVVLERMGQWRKGVSDFRKALAIKPDQPDVLNYLGYTYIDAGENLDEGLMLIEKALSLQPDAGFIIDSLGWAHYHLGHYQRAVRYLERAVEREPGQPTISDHLGDAYWQAGRHLEARFQWRHTLSLKPDDDIDLDKVQQKLAHGLHDAPEIANARP